jgi:hypothetical protein
MLRFLMRLREAMGSIGEPFLKLLILGYFLFILSIVAFAMVSIALAILATTIRRICD